MKQPCRELALLDDVIVQAQWRPGFAALMDKAMTARWEIRKRMFKDGDIKNSRAK